MGKINYTLLNASVLNASRLNMTGETGKPGGGAGGYWPDGTPDAIRRSAVLWYDIAKQGATNETMAANPVLKDLSGHGHDATCYNFGWEGMSGIGGYGLSFSQYSHILQDRATIEFNGNYTTIIKSVILPNWQLYNKVSQETVIPVQKIRIIGIPDGIVVKYQKRVDSNSIIILSITEDGDYDIPQFTTSDIYGFEIEQVVEECNIVIEQLPLYPNALVSDGVDDYAMVEGLPILTPERGYTIIVKRKTMLPTGTLVSNRVRDNVSGAFVFELNATRTDSFGMSNNVIRTESLISYQTKSMYNGLELYYGAIDGVDKLLLFRLNPVAMTYMCQSALYSLLLFNRDLTDEEIEWVKNNLIENNTEG